MARKLLWDIVASTTSVLSTTLAIGAVLAHWQVANLSLLYLLGILWLAARRGRAAALLASIQAFLASDWFFIAPMHTFDVEHPQEWISLTVFLVVALVAGQAFALERRNALVAAEHDRHTQLLYELSTELTVHENLGSTFNPMLQYLTNSLGLAELRLYIWRDGLRELAGTAQASTGGPRVAAGPPLQIPCRIGQTELAGMEAYQATPLSQEDLRVLKGFANQLANALERRRLEKEEKLNRILEETNRTKSSLLAAVSHDLRTPLAAIKASATSLLQSEPAWDDETRREFATSINNEADRMDRLVANLLDMSRIESGVLAPRLEWHNLAEIAADVIDRLQPVSQGHELQLVAEDREFLCHVDYVQMTQVVMNLVENAIRHGAPGGPIQVKVGDREIVVENRGGQLSAEDLPLIFERFYHGSEASSGTGLGLAIAKGIIEAHGGHIWAANTADGVAFHLSLPAETEALVSLHDAVPSA